LPLFGNGVVVSGLKAPAQPGAFSLLVAMFTLISIHVIRDGCFAEAMPQSPGYGRVRLP
jgi:hypothetical protein